MDEYKVTSMINQSDYKLSDLSKPVTGRVLWLKATLDGEGSCFLNQNEVDSLLNYLNSKTKNFGGHKTELATDKDKPLNNLELIERAIKLTKNGKDYYVADLLLVSGEPYPFQFKLIGIHEPIN